MRWLELRVEVPREFVETVSHLFLRYGRGLCVEETADPDRVVVSTYLSARATRRRAGIDVGVRLLRYLAPVGDLETRPVDRRDWEEAWKAHFSPIRVGRRLVIKPSWVDVTPAPGQVVVELDPGMAFGTGHHPTTRTCLEVLEERVTPGMRVLDVGTGSGILAISAVLLGAGTVVACDTDRTAVAVARRNARTNGVRVRFFHGTLPSRRVPSGFFDLVVANITYRAIVELAPHLARACAPGGLVVASGLVEHQATETEEALARVGLHLKERRQTDDWVTLLARR